MSHWTFNDGGRAAAGYKGTAGDCVTRALAIATGESYAEVYAEVTQRAGKTARNGVPKHVGREFLLSRGWRWTPTMTIGSGCTVQPLPIVIVGVHCQPRDNRNSRPTCFGTPLRAVLPARCVTSAYTSA